MKKDELEVVAKNLNDLKKAVKRLGMPRSNLHDLDIALSVIERVADRMEAKGIE